MKRAKRLINKATLVLKEDPARFIVRGVKYTYYHTFPNQRPKHIHHKDILFIDGTNLDFLVRYRIEHLMEQLAANGMTSDSIYVGELSLDLVRRYSGFVFYRNIPNDLVREFLRLAKYHNKTCFFSIDDLVIDTEYTQNLKAVKSMTVTERNLYNQGVKGYGDMMRLCSYSITTTDVLADEMKLKGSGEVLVNRNVMSQKMIALSDNALKEVKRDSSRVILGYFSGSNTHNVDLQMILPALRKVLEHYDNVYLKLIGRINPPKGLEKYSDRLILMPYMDWKLLPAHIRECDINLAPLAENTIFNRAKSEIKWDEAALVKTVTLASDIGSYRSEIKNGITGVLTDNTSWYEKLSKLIDDKKYRDAIAANAYEEVRDKRTTLGVEGRKLANFLRDKMSENIKFIIPSVEISGGINVIFKHAEILREAGYDVTLVSIDEPSDMNRLNQLNTHHNVVLDKDVEINQLIDKIVATHWLTFEYMKTQPNAIKRYYLVQGYESLIYPPGVDARIRANATYSDKTGVQFITISPWCVTWLQDNFNQVARYAPNGLNLSNFPLTERIYSGKIKVLIEGNHKDPLKNIDEAFKITNSLDKERYSISYLSYDSKPKKEYDVDEVYNKIHPDKVGQIYAKHHILLKTSLLESFSFPPLEMMATGGQVVAMKNAGNSEYISNNNAVIIKPGDIAGGITAIEQLTDDEETRSKLRKNGLETVKRYDWKNLINQIIELYN